MKKMKEIILICFFVLFHFYLYPAFYDGQLFSLLQPNGSYVEVVVYGDEYYQRIESIDGYTLIRDPDINWICYAQLNSDKSSLVSTGVFYIGTNVTTSNERLISEKHLEINDEDKINKIYETRDILNENGIIIPGADVGINNAQGDYLGLTILIDFADEPAAIPVSDVEEFVNGSGYTQNGNNGSVREYFYDVSGGKLNYYNTVTGYYRAKFDKAYYNNSSVPYGTRARELIHEALRWLDESGFDFSTLSTDSQNRIFAINIIYAGTADVGWAQGLWPHKGYLSPAFEADGVKSAGYQITCAYNTNSMKYLVIGTFCHENGHLLMNWPDLYDYGGQSRGIGRYGLMASGNYLNNGKNPAPPNPYLRASSGWEMLTDITYEPYGTVLNHRPGQNITYQYRNLNNPKEYFLVESRIAQDRDLYIPDEGLVIWHIDENGSNNNEQMTANSHYKVSIEQADGYFDLENNSNNGDSSDFFHADYRFEFNDLTSPNAKWWDSTYSRLDIQNISSVSSQMSFTLGREVSTPTPGPTPTPTPLISVTPTPTVVLNVLAFDNFNSGLWSGGSGWSSQWCHDDKGNTMLYPTDDESPGYCMKIMEKGYIYRYINFEDKSKLNISFNWKAESFELEDLLYVWVYDGNWTEVHQVGMTERMNEWETKEVNLSTIQNANDIIIYFQAKMDASDDCFYFDDIVVKCD